ncbi:TIGR02450 family Trp-rich protein [Pseudomonadota bacterium]
MNSLSSKKILNSKWTAANPTNKEKHFLVTEVEYDENGVVIRCLIEAVMTRRSRVIEWRSLQNGDQWVNGWR